MRTRQVNPLRACRGRSFRITRGALLLAALGLAASTAWAAPQAFRFSDLDLRDPHTFVSFLGCRDFTDVQLVGFSFNSDVQSRIQNDTDQDGSLDQNWLLVWDDLVPGASSDQLLFISGRCTAPMAGTSCESGLESSPVVLSSSHSASGGCLGAIAGTTRPYTPAVATVSSPCFVTAPMVGLLRIHRDAGPLHGPHTGCGAARQTRSAAAGLAEPRRVRGHHPVGRHGARAARRGGS